MQETPGNHDNRAKFPSFLCGCFFLHPPMHAGFRETRTQNMQETPGNHDNRAKFPSFLCGCFYLPVLPIYNEWNGSLYSW
jgi:hypothetical protein